MGENELITGVVNEISRAIKKQPDNNGVKEFLKDLWSKNGSFLKKQRYSNYFNSICSNYCRDHNLNIEFDQKTFKKILNEVKKEIK